MNGTGEKDRKAISRFCGHCRDIASKVPAIGEFPLPGDEKAWVLIAGNFEIGGVGQAQGSVSSQARLVLVGNKMSIFGMAGTTYTVERSSDLSVV